MEEKPLRINKKFIARLSHPALYHFRAGKRQSNDSIEHCSVCCEEEETTGDTGTGTGYDVTINASCNGTCVNSCNGTCLLSCDGNCIIGTGSLPITGAVIDCPCI